MNRFLAHLLILPLRVLSLLPLKVHYLFADVLAWLMEKVVKYRRRVIDVNLKMVFGDKSDGERKEIAHGYYKYLADVICEIVWGLGRSFEQIRRSGMFRIDDRSCEVFNNALLEGRSVVLLLGHCGNWELLTGMAVYMPHSEVSYDQVTCAYKQLHSPLSQELMLLMRRRHMNLEGNLVPSHKFVRYALGHKDENRAYFLISDQYTSTPTCTTTFLGLETGWAGGGEMIARRLHSPVLYIYVDKEQRCGYVIKILQICNDASAVEPSEVVRTYSALLESDILARPACWLWSHKRWKNLKGSDYKDNQ